jgi:LmbE family N-acetylglucosaminyl deacetylase
MADLVISPHLDDAVFSLGQYLAGRPGTAVATVFAGRPDRSATGIWDQRCGFPDGREAMTARRAEDIEALAVLRCEAVHLDFYDLQYGRPATDEQISAAIRRLISERQPSTVLGPVGLVHPDHQQVGRVWRPVARQAALASIAYEELPYRVQFPAMATGAVGQLIAAGATAVAADRGGRDVKTRAIGAYRSQLGLMDTALCLYPERLWSLPDRPAPRV